MGIVNIGPVGSDLSFVESWGIFYACCWEGSRDHR